MIAFNKGYENDKNDKGNEDSLKKLEDILFKIYQEDLTDESIEDANLSELLEIVYFHLFTENYTNINLSIIKNKNNSLKIEVNDLK
jgi:hypothetical protein